MGTVAGAAAIVGTTVSIIGAGVSAVGAIQQGQAQSKAANYQAQVARNNATVAAQNAQAANDQASAKGEVDLRNSTLRGSAQRAAIGASGGTLDSGSAVDVTASTAATGAQTVNQDLYSGQLQAYGYASQQGNYTAQAGLDTMQAANANQAGIMGAGSSILSGASQVASKWGAWNRTTSGTTGLTSGIPSGPPREGDLY